VPEEELASLRKAGYFLDLRHWRAHRSNPIDVSDDEYVLDVRGGDAGRGPFADNWEPEKRQPRFMIDPEKTGRRTLRWEDLIQRKLGFDDVYFISEANAVPFDASHQWQEGDTIPRRLLRPGDGSPLEAWKELEPGPMQTGIGKDEPRRDAGEEGDGKEGAETRSDAETPQSGRLSCSS
jgi:hypothetical protein